VVDPPPREELDSNAHPLFVVVVLLRERAVGSLPEGLARMVSILGWCLGGSSMEPVSVRMVPVGLDRGVVDRELVLNPMVLMVSQMVRVGPALVAGEEWNWWLGGPVEPVIVHGVREGSDQEMGSGSRPFQIFPLSGMPHPRDLISHPPAIPSSPRVGVQKDFPVA